MTEHDRIDEKIYYQIHKIALKQKSYIAGHPNIFVMLNDIEESLKQPRRKLSEGKVLDQIIQNFISFEFPKELASELIARLKNCAKALCDPNADIWEA